MPLPLFRGSAADRVAIFIDGAYLDNVLRAEFQNAQIDFQALSDSLAAESNILRTYYYHCPSYRSNPPTPQENDRYSNQRRFFDALERLRRYTVRLGRLAYRDNNESGAPIFEQKRVDILLGVDLVQLAAKQAIQEAVLVAEDSDFIPAVVAAKSEGILVRLYHGDRPHSDLWQEADERIQLTQSLIDSVRR